MTRLSLFLVRKEEQKKKSSKLHFTAKDTDPMYQQCWTNNVLM